MRSGRCSFRFVRDIDLHVYKDWNHTCWRLWTFSYICTVPNVKSSNHLNIFISEKFPVCLKTNIHFESICAVVFWNTITTQEEIAIYIHEWKKNRLKNYPTSNQHLEHIVCLLSMCISGPYGEGEQILGVWGETLQNTADWVQFDARG